MTTNEGQKVNLTERELYKMLVAMYELGEENGNSFNQGSPHISALKVIRKYYSDVFFDGFLDEVENE